MQQVQDVEWWMDFPSREARPVVFALRIHFDSLGCRKLIWIRFGILIDYVRKASELRESSRSMEFAAPHTGTLRESCDGVVAGSRESQCELSENSVRTRNAIAEMAESAVIADRNQCTGFQIIDWMLYPVNRTIRRWIGDGVETIGSGW